MFARIKKNTNTERRSVLVCRSVRQGEKVRQEVIKILGHSASIDELQSLLNEAKTWITNHKVQWLDQNKRGQARIRVKLQHKDPKYI